MPIAIRNLLLRSFRLDIWWRWSCVSIIGVILGALLLRYLESLLLPPRMDMDEDFQLWHPWRLAALNGVLYAPLSIAQWWILRRSISRAVEWLVLTIGSVVLIYPSLIWLFSTLGLENLAWFVWFFGLGGSAVYALAQCLTPLRWLSISKRWLLWPAAALVVGTSVLQISQQFAALWHTQLSATDPRAMIATWGVYYVIMGLILAYILHAPIVQGDRATNL